MKQVNIQGDREFQALSEYLLTLRKDYYLSYDLSKTQTGYVMGTTTFWNFDHESNSIPSAIFFNR